MMRKQVKDSSAKQRLDRDGFVLLSAFVCGDQLQKLQENVSRFICDVLPTLPSECVFYDVAGQANSLKQIQQLGQHDPWFEDLIEAGPFRELAETLLAGPVVPKNLQYFNKPPSFSNPTPPHQDGYYFMLQPPLAITMWLALDPADPQNGCVRYVPGSHLHEMRLHARTGTLGFSQGITDYPNDVDEANEVAICAEPGDLLVHHAMTIHRADQNGSIDRQRRSLGLIYYSADAKEDTAAHEAYQRKLVSELKATGKI